MKKLAKPYANDATSQAVKDAVETCGYSGDMWGTDHLNHYHWCIRNSAQTVKAEAERRSEAVKKCDRCKVYAEEATSAQSENRPSERHFPVVDGIKVPPMTCGYSGDAWTWDKKAHTRWCAAVSDDDARRETENRKRWLDICTTCRGYAHKAVVAYHSVWSRCKSFWSNQQMSGEDWSTDHQHHFKWCMGLDAERRAVNVEFAGARRERIVNACIAKVSQPLVVQPAAKAETRKRVPAEPKRAATKPVTTARKPSADSDKPAVTSKKVPSSGSSAMDRLGGGPSPSGTASGGAGGGSRRGPSAAAQPSSPSGSGTGGAAAPATTINRNVIGGGSSERVR